MEAVTHYADGFQMTDTNYPSEAIAMHIADPNWDYNTSEGTWQ